MGQRLVSIVLYALLLTSSWSTWYTSISAQLIEDEMPESDVIGLITKLSNWGRWGSDDQLGLLNLLTNESRLKTIALVETGKTVSVSRTITFDISEDTTVQNQRFFLSTGEATQPSDGEKVPRSNYAIEWIGMVFHGLSITHIDTPSHVFWDGTFYNNHSATFFTGRQGATVGSIMNLANGVVGRGVLLDIPGSQGIDWPHPLSSWIYSSDLDRALEYANTSVGAGDIVLLRTGFYKYFLEKGPVNPQDSCPGLHPSAMSWFRQRDVALLGTDTPGDRAPPPYPNVPTPVHTLGIYSMGMWIIDNADFEVLERECRQAGRFEFLLTLSPLKLSAVTGSPVNPIVIF